MSKQIHVCGAGGVAGIGMTRCLKEYDLQGHDGSLWAEKMMECDHEKDKGNLYYTDMIIPVPDKLVKKYADCDLCFLPDEKQIDLCQDKAKTAEVLGDLAPKVYWVRDTDGAGGKGRQMAQEYLGGRNMSVEFCFYNDKLIGYFQKERLSYSVKGDMKSDEPLEKVGSSAVSVCRKNEVIIAFASSALDRIAQYTKTPLHGFYGVDLKEGDDGFKVTEINAGRLLTASYVYYYSTDYNLALAGVKAFFGEKYKLGKYPEGIGVIRQTDCKPYVGEL